jgi:hypothetical protein
MPQGVQNSNARKILKFLWFMFCFLIITSHVRVYCQSRDSAVNINITGTKETYYLEPKHEHLTVGIRHIVVAFTIL